MYYAIRHVTTFRYSAPIGESMMEVRMQPRHDRTQRLVSFDVHTAPHARIFSYHDHWGNMVHHFDVPNRHTKLTITTRAQVERTPPPPLPERLDGDTWRQVDQLTATDAYWDTLQPSRFTPHSGLLQEVATDLRVGRHTDPLTLLRDVTTAIYHHFAYVPQSTRADSPIDEALRTRQGVCQDYAHVMIALIREVGLPCRYVSGYLCHRGAHDQSAADATHAWVEALLPGLGWVGFDPTNNMVVGERHIAVAVGRDYGDVPPTHGVFKGDGAQDLAVSVQVTPTSDQ